MIFTSLLEVYSFLIFPLAVHFALFTFLVNFDSELLQVYYHFLAIQDIFIYFAIFTSRELSIFHFYKFYLHSSTYT